MDPSSAPSSPHPHSEAVQVPKHRPFTRCRVQRDAYEKIAQVGRGAFGAVWKCRCRETGRFVALKKVLMKNETEGFPLTALREIKIMKLLDHNNVLGLIEVVHSAATNHNRQLGDIFMVFEYMEHDLGGILNLGTEFTLPEIKCLSNQLLQGMHYLHTNKILHRDLKVANLLLNAEGVLKIADFGLARGLDKDGRYTGTVVTRWYRAPELLLGERHYTTAIDMWSVGVIVAELFTGAPILQGGVLNAADETENDIDQFLEICKLIGSPTVDTWSDFIKFQGSFVLPKHTYKRSTEERFSRTFRVKSPDGIQFVDTFLVFDPKKRPTAHLALDHDFLWSDPLPCQPHQIRKFAKECHDYTIPPSNKRIQPPKKQSEVQRPPPHEGASTTHTRTSDARHGAAAGTGSLISGARPSHTSGGGGIPSQATGSVSHQRPPPVSSSASTQSRPSHPPQQQQQQQQRPYPSQPPPPSSTAGSHQQQHQQPQQRASQPPYLHGQQHRYGSGSHSQQQHQQHHQQQSSVYGSVPPPPLLQHAPRPAHQAHQAPHHHPGSARGGVGSGGSAQQHQQHPSSQRPSHAPPGQSVPPRPSTSSTSASGPSPYPPPSRPPFQYGSQPPPPSNPHSHRPPPASSQASMDAQNAAIKRKQEEAVEDPNKRPR